jgi:8-oxo-dGTP pyrophosphatase MutT (NUDIX family)
LPFAVKPGTEGSHTSGDAAFDPRIHTIAARTKSPSRFLRNPGAIRVQCGALCWRMAGEDVQVLLVTSRDTGRWVIPKGWPIAGLTPQASAAREAWEEAGVEGVVADEPAGLYAYDKIMTPAFPIHCIVSVYPLYVTHLHRRFPEAAERQRKWFSLQKAAKKVTEPGLQHILHRLAPPLPSAMPLADGSGQKPEVQS